jgi:hypothetical protein
MDFYNLKKNQTKPKVSRLLSNVCSVCDSHLWSVQVELTTLLARQRKGREKEQAMSRKVKLLFYSFVSLSICRLFLTLMSSS